VILTEVLIEVRQAGWCSTQRRNASGAEKGRFWQLPGYYFDRGKQLLFAFLFAFFIFSLLTFTQTNLSKQQKPSVTQQF